MPRKGLLALTAGVFALAAFPPGDALAQCSMCRTALEQNPDAAAGFNRAILFLLATPYAVFGSLAAYVAISRRRRAAAAPDGEPDSLAACGQGGGSAESGPVLPAATARG